jgi:hypothetical protein
MQEGFDFRDQIQEKIFEMEVAKQQAIFMQKLERGKL